ncbi:serine carboxypeptidase-like 51 isoform X2 [Iris pallida]|uniref:Serine carboxypeptidase-like 51 isoform X2 n=1 Tax=Iris pallida TaxID=29817 RepID=A0AAX6H4L3_IRIPA|nr:serine carboxypeptidase-like 51 isoform X2 [Iris pallida]
MVGTGYSFLEDNTLFVKIDEEAVTDLTTMLKALYNKNSILRKISFCISYKLLMGKFTWVSVQFQQLTGES